MPVRKQIAIGLWFASNIIAMMLIIYTNGIPQFVGAIWIALAISFGGLFSVIAALAKEDH